MKHPVDVHVGKRVRHRRWMVGMTQQQLGEAVGIKFQQIQKYETGMNRVSASRLWDIATVMSVPISFFFEGLDGRLLKVPKRPRRKVTCWPTKKHRNWSGRIMRSRKISAAACLIWHAC